MGSERSAAGGGRSDSSEWQRSIDDVADLSARKISATATGDVAERCLWQMKRGIRSGSGR